MLTLEQMVTRFILALILGALLGWERETIHKEAGIRTSILVSGGASLFAMIGMVLPYILGNGRMAGENGAMGVIANVVVGIGFLGAGLIIRADNRVQNLTTAAVVWFIAAIGVLCGIGFFKMAIFAGISTTILLYLLRNMKVEEDSQKRLKT